MGVRPGPGLTQTGTGSGMEGGEQRAQQDATLQGMARLERYRVTRHVHVWKCRHLLGVWPWASAGRYDDRAHVTPFIRSRMPCRLPDH